MKEEKKEDSLTKLQKEVDEWKNKYYLVLADTQNLRKSLEEDHREALRYRSMGFLEKLLPALDSFYIALGPTPNTDEAKNYQKGFEFIYKQLNEALMSEGVKEILPKDGDTFDPKTMHALDTVEGDKDNLVTHVYSKGYLLHERLIKPAMVQVSKKPEEKKEEEHPEEKTNQA